MKSFLSSLLAIVVLLSVSDAYADKIANPIPEETAGSVKLPLNTYDDLVLKTRDPKQPPRMAPADYAIGHADVSVRVSESNKRASALVSVDLAIQVLVNDWTVVPLLPTGTPIRSATVDGKPVELIHVGNSLGWGTKSPGNFKMNLQYELDAARFESGFSAAPPLPTAASVVLTADLPGAGLDVAVIPSAGAQITSDEQSTRIKATIPAGSGVQLSWRVPTESGFSISRAAYSGELKGEAILWKATLEAELFSDDSSMLKLLPETVTVDDVTIDGQKGVVTSKDGYLSVNIKRRGSHKIEIGFQVPIVRSEGHPQANLIIPQVPISKFELLLPGKKELAILPVANVETKSQGESTKATFNVPMTDQLKLSWSEAVPEEVKAEVRENASVYHAIHAEEGVLYAKAIAVFDVTRGETNVFEIEIPKGVQINRIQTQEASISDWHGVKGESGGPDKVTIFLDRQIRGEITFTLDYDSSIAGEISAEDISVPLLKALNTSRQRGMVALLSSKDLTLKPVSEKQITHVGENQLPAFVRETIDKSIAHTYKYAEVFPELSVRATAPDRQQGKFDAVVNTLISLGDVTLKGNATVELNVKSGKIGELELKLPKHVNLLNLTAPSLRTHTVVAGEDKQTVQVQFTQEIEGEFRLEVTYEFIMNDGVDAIEIPTLSVMGAEVEQGKIAIEALSAVEVQPSEATHLSYLDPSELPQQLVLKTSNPILLGYKYAHIEPPYKLRLKVSRHQEVEVQKAVIDSALYKTLFTQDGLAITTADFIIRNSQKQFLRVALPPNSEIWSASVDGKIEKPALASAQSGDTTQSTGPSVLVRIINSTQGFPVRLIYQTQFGPLSSLGVLTATLPRPLEMAVTRSRWEAYLPDNLKYGKVRTEMTIVEEGVSVNSMGESLPGSIAKNRDGISSTEPLQIDIPETGIRYVFEKLYANKSELDATFSMPYATPWWNFGGGALVSLGAILFWLGIGWMVRLDAGVKRAEAVITSILGSVILAITIGYFGASYIPAAAISAAAVCAYLSTHFKNLRVKSQQAMEFKPSGD